MSRKNELTDYCMWCVMSRMCSVWCHAKMNSQAAVCGRNEFFTHPHHSLLYVVRDVTQKWTNRLLCVVCDVTQKWTHRLLCVVRECWAVLHFAKTFPNELTGSSVLCLRESWAVSHEVISKWVHSGFIQSHLQMQMLGIVTKKYSLRTKWTLQLLPEVKAAINQNGINHQLSINPRCDTQCWVSLLHGSISFGRIWELSSCSWCHNQVYHQ